MQETPAWSCYEVGSYKYNSQLFCSTVCHCPTTGPSGSGSTSAPWNRRPYSLGVSYDFWRPIRGVLQYCSSVISKMCVQLMKVYNVNGVV